MLEKTAENLTLHFKLMRGGELIDEMTFSSEHVTLGSGDMAMLRVEHESVAEMQAVINIEDDGSVQLTDMADGSILHNGVPVMNCSLAEGDVLTLGDVEIHVTLDDGAVEVTDQADWEEDETGDDPDTDPGVEDRVIYHEDPLAYLMRTSKHESPASDTKRPKYLEVSQVWKDMILDTNFYPPGSKDVLIGTTIGYRWRLGGYPIAWVPEGFAKVCWLLAPTISEAQQESRTDFFLDLPGLGVDEFSLFKAQGNQYLLVFHENWGGNVNSSGNSVPLFELISSGQATSIGNGLYTYPLPADAQLLVEIGNVTFFARMVHPNKKIVTAITDDLDYPFMISMMLMSVLGVILSFLIATMTPPPKSNMLEIPDRFAKVMLEKPEVEERNDPKPSGNPDAGEGAKAKKEEGKVGKKDAKMQKAKGNKVKMDRKKLDREIAENAGVLGALGESSELDGVFGSSGLSSDIAGGIGGLIGAKGTQIGSGGLGSRGSGLGGGGTAEGLGGLGTRGRGSGSSGYGTGGGHLGAKGTGGIGQVGGDPIILGSLDKALIDAVIRQHMNQIRYCYQRELTKNPSLNGKIVVKFVIAGNGTVSSATTKTSTMGSPAVEGCINGRFMNFKFPEPKGGGIVIVSYPFLFAPG